MCSETKRNTGKARVKRQSDRKDRRTISPTAGAQFMKYGKTLSFVGAAALSVMLALTSPFTASADNTGKSVYPGGMPFGIEMNSDGVIVIGTATLTTADGDLNPASAAGFENGDIIKKINGEPIDDKEEMIKLVSESGGKELSFMIERDKKAAEITMKPVKTSDGYRCGLWVRDSMIGIGTVTYITADKTLFAGLGHGVCDIDTGELIPLKDGNVYNAVIYGVKRGEKNAPGELKGCFSGKAIGNIGDNTENGVSGTLSSLPDGFSDEAVLTGSRNDVKEGDAYIYCSTDNGVRKKYAVKISDIDYNGRDNKNFSVTITDDELLGITGGIVQGMSGSPIIQNGRLIGALTHVLVKSPESGYGIFIDNMPSLETKEKAA